MTTTPAVSATDEAPASNQIRSEVFEFVLRVSRLFTMSPFYQFDTKTLNCYLKTHVEKLSKKEHIAKVFPETRFFVITYKLR